MKFLPEYDMVRIMKAKVTTKGQVTIPIAIRARLGIRPGDELDFRAEDGCVVARKGIPAGAFDALRVHMQESGAGEDPFEGLSALEMLDEMRGPVMLPDES